MYQINAKNEALLELGRVGENQASSISFNLNDWVEVFGEGTPVLINQRPSEDAGYPIGDANLTYADHILTWKVTSADTQYLGYGKLQLEFRIGTTIVKSAIYTTHINNSIDGSDNPPAPWQAWVDVVLKARDDAEDARDEALSYVNKSVRWDVTMELTEEQKARARANIDATGGEGNVLSVNGKVGHVILNASDVGATTQSYVDGVADDLSDDIDDVDAALVLHSTNTSNPHSVTKAQVGLGNADNTSDADKPVSTAQATAINAKYTKPGSGIPYTDLASGVKASLDKADTALQEHQSLSAYRTSSAQDVIDNAQDAVITAHTGNTSNPHSVTKAQLGLGNVDNTSDVNKPISTATQNALNAITSDVDTIEGKIPTQASSSNQLADKSFVNSSIATETAHYISNEGEPFTSVAQLEAYSGVVTNNDYAFVTGTDEQGNTYYDRYKATVVGSTVTWAKEYRLNNSAFTSAQWSAISSGITSALVGSYNTHLADSTIHVTSTDKATWNAKQDAIPANTYDAYGSASAVQGNLDTHTGNTTVHITSSERSTWNAKQDAIPENTYDAYGSASAVQGNLDTHTGNSTIHVTAQNKTDWNAKYDKPASGIPDSDIASASTWNAKQNQHTTQTAELTVAGWSNKSQTVNVTGVTATNTIIVAPSVASNTAYAEAEILCTTQGSGTLTFTCETVPTSAISVNVVIMGV